MAKAEAQLSLIDRQLTLKEALNEEIDVLHCVTHVPATEQLYRQLWQERRNIANLVKHHLSLNAQDECIVLPPKYWMRGSFNVCVVLEVKSATSPRKVIFRCPMPHKLCEERYPGSVDEKLEGEVGAYVWVEEHCPEIHTPSLYGFGFLNGRQVSFSSFWLLLRVTLVEFTHIRQLPWYTRAHQHIRRFIYKVLRRPLLSNYAWHPTKTSISSAYMVLEYLGSDTGRLLSDTFNENRDDRKRMQNLCKSISQIMLSLARVPQPRIGSFKFAQDGTVALVNRPLLCSMAIAESGGATRVSQPDDSLGNTEAFVSDLLSLHDNRFMDQGNAIYSESDCRGQMAVKTVLRATAHRYIKRELRNGPFLIQHDDLHASNILVDDEWNIKALIDLEWICALPAEMLALPYWLTGCSIDQLQDSNLDAFEELRRDFLHIFEREEDTARQDAGHDISLTTLMKETWETKAVWFWYCLSSTNAMYFLVESHLSPPTALSTDAEKAISQFWCVDSDAFVEKKLADKKAYDNQIHELFRTLK